MSEQETDDLTPEQIEAQEEADFAAGFSGEETDERPRDEKGRFVAEDGKDDEGAEESEQADDEKSAEGQTDAEAEAETDEAVTPEPEDKVAKRLSRVEGHIGGIYNELKRVLSATDELKSALSASKETREAGGEAPSKEQVKEALKSGEKMEALKDEFPEWAEAMEEERQRTIEHLRAEMGSKMLSREDAERLADERAQSAAANAVSQARALALLDFKHPGWEAEVNTPEFIAWVRQDEDRIAATQSDSVTESLELLDEWDKFKQTLRVGENRENQQRNESRLLRSIPATQSRGASDIEKSPTEQEDFEAGFYGR